MEKGLDHQEPAIQSHDELSDASKQNPVQPPVQEATEEDRSSAPQPSEKDWVNFEVFSQGHKESSLFAKIDCGLHYMKKALAHPSHPKFTDFWACRRWVGPFIEAVESKQQRDDLKSSFNDLLVEARGLKLLLDEQLRLSLDKIEKKLSSLEQELLPLDSSSQEQSVNEGALHCPEPWQTSNWPENFAKIDQYAHLQGAFEWSNSYASQIQSLRKEIMQTSMRLGQKNKLLSRLSKVGDVVFPQKKKAAQDLSKIFIADIRKFQQSAFPKEEAGPSTLPKTPLFKLRSQIQSLQTLAKKLGINAAAFKTSREVLSSCWNRLKDFDKVLSQKREEHDQKNAAQLENFLREIENIKRQKSSGSLSDEVVLKRLKGLDLQVRKERLSKTHAERFAQELDAVRKPILEKQNLQEQEAQKQKEKKNQAVQSRIQHFKSSFESLIQELLQEKSPSFTQMHQLLKQSYELKSQWDLACQREGILPQDREEVDTVWEEFALSACDRAKTSLPPLSEDDIACEDLLHLFDEILPTLESRLEVRKAQAGLDFALALEVGEKQDLLQAFSEELESLRA